MTDIDTLQGLGFSVDDSGVLVAPKDSRVSLTPIGTFFELKIHLSGGGTTIIAVLSKSALKITRAEETMSEIDTSAMITGTSRKGRPW